jgi:hypothetical protein
VKKVNFILSHWHCIIPAIAIIVGMALMNGNKKEVKPQRQTEPTKAP